MKNIITDITTTLFMMPEKDDRYFWWNEYECGLFWKKRADGTIQRNVNVYLTDDWSCDINLEDCGGCGFCIIMLFFVPSFIGIYAIKRNNIKTKEEVNAIILDTLSIHALKNI